MKATKPLIAVLALCISAMLAGCAGGTAESAGSSAAEPEATSSASAPSSTPASAPAAALVLADYPVSHDPEFGGVFIEIPIQDFNDLGFAFGDSVNIEFSNGYALEGLPYYSGYYVEPGETLLVGYPGYPYIRAGANFGDDLWETAGLADGDTATVTLVEPGAFAATQEALNIAYTDEPADYPSEVAFANFREMAVGNLKPGMFFRGASPVNNEHNRAACVNRFISDAGVQVVFDLADNDEEIAKYLAESAQAQADVSYFEGLHDASNVIAVDLNAAYQTQEYAEKLAGALVELTQHEGPVYIHCTEGKDRTGFVCLLLEALAGADYNQLVDDYMVTYDNYYQIDREGEPEKYTAIKELNFDSMARYLAGLEKGAPLEDVDFAAAARNYLLAGGMTDEQVDALTAYVRA